MRDAHAEDRRGGSLPLHDRTACHRPLFQHETRFSPEEAHARGMQRLSPPSHLGRGFCPKQRHHADGQIPAGFHIFHHPAGSKGPCQPSFQQSCPGTAMFQLETAHRVHEKCNDGMACKLHLPQRTNPQTHFIFKRSKVLLRTLVCHQVMDSSSLAPCLKSADSTAGVCKSKWEISSLHIWPLQISSSEGYTQQGPKQIVS